MTREPRSSIATRLTPGAASAGPFDPPGILASIGLVPYDWRIDTDALTWGPNAADVLRVADGATIATGRGYATYLDPKNASSRYDAVTQTAGPDAGAGVPYQTACRPAQTAERGSGSRIPAAGSAGRTDVRRGRTASCAS